MTRSDQFTDWVAEKNKNHPYFDHALTVAKLAAPVASLAYEVGLCHDMLEDQLCTAQQLRNALNELNYNDHETRQVLTAVQELTDVFTLEDFPQLTKKQRRKEENKRLISTGSLAQTVKYADLIDNAAWIKQNRPDKWERYKKRKYKLLQKMDQGDPALRQTALKIFEAD